MADISVTNTLPQAKRIDFLSELKRGVWTENPVFRQILGTCPTLAVTNTIRNSIAIGLATTFVLITSSLIVSAIRKFVPGQVRIATFTVIIAAFVTIADQFLAAMFPPVSKALGPFVPLIVVNCIILGRHEAFASKNPVKASLVDAIVMSCGFITTVTCLGLVREILGSGSILAGTPLGFQLLGAWFSPWVVMLLPAGAFLSLGIGLGIMNHLGRKNTKRG